ncbi:hypothetical protein AMS68_001494 [Peltaster fructicola]|uniref:F-box domain-containing protein n=1 Tax=Peltaster fructicola TaxID=286661 RepID=A0A6H0XMK3_9PEZI|nr:hypothetical protein AMS68_001494 [Peltaster fructicola]
MVLQALDNAGVSGVSSIRTILNLEAASPNAAVEQELERDFESKDRCFRTPELLEMILLEVPCRDVLLAQRVSRRWKLTIEGSKMLQRHLFMQPVTGGTITRLGLNTQAWLRSAQVPLPLRVHGWKVMSAHHGPSHKGGIRRHVDNALALFGQSSTSRGEYELVDSMAEHDGVIADSKAEYSVQDQHDLAASKEPGTIVLGAHDEANSIDDDGLERPTEEEKQTLRKIADNLPWSAFLIAVIEICERFTYYGLSGVFQNYIQNSPDDPSGLPGALGLGQTAATGLGSFFQFFSYLTPILGAVIADQYLGRYWTILYFAIVYCIGNFILFLSALPVSIEHGAALGGLITSMIVIGLATGGIKSNVSPLIAEQYSRTTPYVRTLKSGERVIVDPAVTIQRIYMVFYACINIGSLSPIATVYLEKYIGFWSAYLLCACVFIVGIITIILGKNKYIMHPPKGSVIPNAFRVCFIALKHKGKLNSAKPEVRRELGLKSVKWDSQFVDEVGRALVACNVFLFFPIYWLVYNQMLNNFISQAGSMELHGIPNDLMQNIDPIAILIFIPIMDRLIYPSLRKCGIPFKPITRITFGFIFGAAAMAYAAGVQKLIYESGPCYDAPGACDAAVQPDGSVIPNHVHVAVQTPAYVLIALSEIFASITGLEYAFTKAPTTMKSFIMSLYLLTTAFGAALGAALSPTAVDPYLLWMYTGLAAACLTAGILFWICYKRYNATEESMNEMEQYGERAVHVNEFNDPARRHSERRHAA